MLVPLQGAAEGAAAAVGFCLARDETICARRTQVLPWQMNQGSEVGSLRYDSGMIRTWFGV